MRRAPVRAGLPGLRVLCKVRRIKLEALEKALEKRS
jgi:hypothetical protein